MRFVRRLVFAAGLFHFGPEHTTRFGMPNGCWVPESAVAPVEEAGHLLQLADALLSAAAWPPLEHFVAAHNLFVHPRYRERVDESAVLSQRRTDLLAKAVEAAQREQRSVPRPESPSVESATPREGRELAVVTPDVACRAQSSRTATVRTTLPVDFHFRADLPDTSVAGETWVHVRPYGCWVPAGYTAPGDTEEHVLRIADRFLTSGEAWSGDNHFRLYTVLSSWNRGHREEVQASAILGLRRLEVLRATLVSLSPEGPRSAEAQTLAWIGALGEEVALTGEGHAWTVSDEAYLTLYDRHRLDPFAEEILWKYASESDAYSCEGEFVCGVQQSVNKRLARYWFDFPNGRHIAAAVESGRSVLAYGLETCNTARGAEPDSREADNWRWSGWERSGADVVRELMETLEGVSEEEKAPLLEVLGELEACAVAVG